MLARPITLPLFFLALNLQPGSYTCPLSIPKYNYLTYSSMCYSPCNGESSSCTTPYLSLPPHRILGISLYGILGLGLFLVIWVLLRPFFGLLSVSKEECLSGFVWHHLYVGGLAQEEREDGGLPKSRNTTRCLKQSHSLETFHVTLQIQMKFRSHGKILLVLRFFLLVFHFSLISSSVLPTESQIIKFLGLLGCVCGSTCTSSAEQLGIL